MTEPTKQNMNIDMTKKESKLDIPKKKKKKVKIDVRLKDVGKN